MYSQQVTAEQQASRRSAAARDLQLPMTNPVVASEHYASTSPSAADRLMPYVVPNVSPMSLLFDSDADGVYGAGTTRQYSESFEY